MIITGLINFGRNILRQLCVIGFLHDIKLLLLSIFNHKMWKFNKILT